MDAFRKLMNDPEIELLNVKIETPVEEISDEPFQFWRKYTHTGEMFIHIDLKKRKGINLKSSIWSVRKGGK